MIGNRFKRQKEAVFNLYERYLDLRGDTNDGIDTEVLNNRVKNLTKDKFILAIVGQVKAGKSTFINALIREKLLPTDVLQNTRAIVEIFKSDKKFISIKYANGETRGIEIHDIKSAYNYLQEIAAVQEKYRALPVVQIDNFLIENVNNLTKEIVDELIESLENAHRLSEKDFHNLVMEYLEENKNLDNIPVEINIGYPLKYEFDEMRIVDSPGVNARGGIQQKTFDYINEANAIIFIHKDSIESSSFREFFEKSIIERKKETLFLVLTWASRFTNDQKLKVEKEAQNLFPEITKEQIISVDSVLWLIYNRIKNGEKIEQIMREDEEAKKIIAPFFIDAMGDNERFINLIKKNSNFDYMERTIEKFSLKAPSIQLSEIVERIKHGMENQKGFLSKEIELLSQKKDSPQFFENEINKIQKALTEYRKLLNEFSESVNQKYTSSISDLPTEIRKPFINSIQACENQNELKKVLIDFNDKTNDVLLSVSNNLKLDYQNEMTRLGRNFKDIHKLTMPKIDISGIEEKARKASYEKVKDKVSSNKGKRALAGGGLGALLGGVAGFFIGGPVGAAIGAAALGAGGGGGGYVSGKDQYTEKSEFNQKKFLDNLKNDSLATIDLTLNETLPDLIRDLTNSYSNYFIKDLGELIKERKQILEKIKNDKFNNDQIIQKISDLESKKKLLEEQMKEEYLESILVNLK